MQAEWGWEVAGGCVGRVFELRVSLETMLGIIVTLRRFIVL